MSCILHLDNFQGQYYPGSTIIGRVVCSFANSENIRGIRLKLKGKEHNDWTKSESHYDSRAKRSKRRIVHYHGDNIFLEIENTLIGPGDLDAGNYEYSFSINLPRNSPGTYDGKYGWVKFIIKATVDRPFKFDYEDKKELKVVAPINFNEMRDILQLEQVAYSDEKTICCCCCASGNITMDVHLEKEAFVVGETANVLVKITNMANLNVQLVKAELGLTVKAVVKLPRHDYKHDYELLAAATDSGVGAHGERIYEFKLEIPNFAVVPNFNLCELFKQWSTLKVTAVLPSCHTNLSISTNVVMGHIPVGGRDATLPYFPPLPPGPPVPPYSSNPPDTHYPPDSKPPLYSTLVPPSGGPTGFPEESGAVPTAPSSNSAAGPSAPPMDDAASAPSKVQLAQEGNGDIVMAGEDKPLLGGNDNKEPPPPSYNEAVSYTSK